MNFEIVDINRGRRSTIAHPTIDKHWRWIESETFWVHMSPFDSMRRYVIDTVIQHTLETT